MGSVMMACGHAANATNAGGKPVCVICVGILAGATIVAGEPDLTGRNAFCAYNCGTIRPSSTDLAFFEYKGPGSPNSVRQCKNCRYYDVAHGQGKRMVCNNFEPIGDQPDLFYCGCKGWD